MQKLEQIFHMLHYAHNKKDLNGQVGVVCTIMDNPKKGIFFPFNCTKTLVLHLANTYPPFIPIETNFSPD
jgi:hypothetical protein